MSRSYPTGEERRAAEAEVRNAFWYGENWKDDQGGFNPDVFRDVDDVTRQKLTDYQIGPTLLTTDDLKTGNVFKPMEDHWSYGKDYDWGDNHGSVEKAVWEMGLPNIETPEHLTQFLDRTDALTAEHGNFLEDGWDPKDIMLYREAPQEVVATAHPVAATPVETTVDVPEVVEQEPVPKEPTEGINYPTGPVNDAIERIRAHNQATHDFTAGAEPNMIQGMEGFVKQSANPSTDFNAEDWIAETSRPDIDQQDHAQSLVNKWTFDIAKNLQPDPQSVVNALTTAFSGPNTVIPGKLGVYS